MHIAQEYAIGSDQGEGNPSPTPRVDCKIGGIKCCNVLCDVGAHVILMSSKVYAMLFNETPNLDATIIKLMDTRDSSKYLFIWMINIRPHLHARMELLHIRGCPLDCAMRPLLFKGA